MAIYVYFWELLELLVFIVFKTNSLPFVFFFFLAFEWKIFKGRDWVFVFYFFIILLNIVSYPKGKLRVYELSAKVPSVPLIFVDWQNDWVNIHDQTIRKLQSLSSLLYCCYFWDNHSSGWIHSCQVSVFQLYLYS